MIGSVFGRVMGFGHNVVQGVEQSIGGRVINATASVLIHPVRILCDKIQKPRLHGTIQAGIAIGSFVSGVLSKGIFRMNYLCSATLSCKNFLLRHVVRPFIKKKYPGQDKEAMRQRIETTIDSIATRVINGGFAGWYIGSKLGVAGGVVGAGAGVFIGGCLGNELRKKVVDPIKTVAQDLFETISKKIPPYITSILQIPASPHDKILVGSFLASSVTSFVLLSLNNWFSRGIAGRIGRLPGALLAGSAAYLFLLAQLRSSKSGYCSGNPIMDKLNNRQIQLINRQYGSAIRNVALDLTPYIFCPIPYVGFVISAVLLAKHLLTHPENKDSSAQSTNQQSTSSRQASLPDPNPNAHSIVRAH